MHKSNGFVSYQFGLGLPYTCISMLVCDSTYMFYLHDSSDNKLKICTEMYND